MADPQAVIQGLLSRGIAPPVALGLAGNAAVESGFNPGINEIAPVVPGSRGGFGLFQWTGPRRKQFEQFAAARNAPLDDLNTQLDFTVWELSNTERRAGEALQGVQDPAEAARIVSERFLRPGTPHLDRRVQETQRLAGRDVSGGNQMQHGLLSTRGSVQGTPFNPQQGQQQAQEPSGILGALSNPDFLDRLAIAFEGLTLNPNQGVIASSSAALQDRAEGRKEQAAQQKAEQRMQSSIEFLRSQGRDDLAQALESGVISPADAGRIALTPAERQGQLVTAEQLRSQFPGSEIEDGLFNLKPDGTVTRVGGSGVTVNTGDSESAFDKETGKVLAQEAATIVEQGAQAQRSLGQIAALEGALERSPSGALGSLTNMASNLGIKTEGSSDIELANAIISQLVPQQRPPGSGVMSDADLALFKASLPRLINTPEGNRKIINTMKAIAQFDMNRAGIARELQLGNITRQEAFQRFSALGNPLEGFDPGTDATAPTGGGARRMRFNPETGQLEPVR